MIGHKETESSQSKQKLSQQELDPKVRGLFNGFKEAFSVIPQFKDLAGVFSSHNSALKSVETSLQRGSDRWTVKRYFIEGNGTRSECLKITVSRPSERTQGFIIVTLGIPYVSYAKNGGDVDISYEQRRLPAYSSPSDIHQNNTQSALTNAEQVLVDLKALPKS